MARQQKATPTDGEDQQPMQMLYDLLSAKQIELTAEQKKKLDPLYRLVLECTGLTLEELANLEISDSATLADVNRLPLIMIANPTLKKLIAKANTDFALKVIFKRQYGSTYTGTMVEWIKGHLNHFNTVEAENFYGVIVKPAIALFRELAVELESLSLLGHGITGVDPGELKSLMMWYERNGPRQRIIDLFVKMAGYFSESHHSLLTQPKVIRALNKENLFVDGGLSGRPADLAKKSRELSMKRIAKHTAIKADELSDGEEDESEDYSSEDEFVPKKKRSEDAQRLAEGEKAIAQLAQLRAKNRAKNQRKKDNKTARLAAAGNANADQQPDKKKGQQQRKKGKNRY